MEKKKQWIEKTKKIEKRKTKKTYDKKLMVYDIDIISIIFFTDFFFIQFPFFYFFLQIDALMKRLEISLSIEDEKETKAEKEVEKKAPIKVD